MGEVTRKIHFYQIVWVKNNGEKVQKSTSFIHNILLKISGQLIVQNNDEFLYLEHDNIKNLSNSNRKLYRLSKIRKSDLPLGFDIKNKDVFPLNLGEYQGLFEPSHFVVFDGKIIGAEYNYYGVRQVHSKLTWLINDYLQQNAHGIIKKVEIKPIMKKEVYDLLDKFVEIRGIYISVATNYAKLLKQDDPQSFGQMFSAAELVDDMRLYLSFTLGKGRRYGDPSRFKEILGLLKRILSRDDSKKYIDFLKIRGKLEGSETVETINILEELILTEKRIPKLNERTRAVDTHSMYQEIIESYNILRRDLEEFMNPVNEEEDKEEI